MNNFWFRAVVPLVMTALLALTAWPVVGPIGALLIAVVILLLQVIGHLRNLDRLMHWLRQVPGAPAPPAAGIWSEIFSALQRRAKRNLALRTDLSMRLERFREAGQAMPDGVVILSRQNAIEWLNATAEDHFGLNPSQDVGMLITNLLRQPDFVAYLSSGQYGEPLVIRSMRRIGHTLALQVISFGEDQKLLLSRDITQLERLETMRRDFIANVSHELKTPLTVVLGFIETLIDAHPNLPHEEAATYLKLAMQQAQRMQRLVDDLLTLSALETDSPPPSEERVDMHALLAEVRRDCEALSAGRHRIETDFGAPAVILGSAKELRSAFVNLASNAVRYTPDGGVIKLTWRLDDGGGTFSVEDNGIGIEAQHIPRLTERFYRIDRGRSREMGGTGLGLAIVKHVLTRHQAALDIASEPGGGSRFTCRFPARRVFPVVAAA